MSLYLYYIKIYVSEHRGVFRPEPGVCRDRAASLLGIAGTRTQCEGSEQGAYDASLQGLARGHGETQGDEPHPHLVMGLRILAANSLELANFS